VIGDTTNLSRTVATWLSNLIEELEAAGSSLEFVFFAQGNKYYGMLPVIYVYLVHCCWMTFFIWISTTH
jgi:hypothetical protein